MKLVVDNALSPVVAQPLRSGAFDCVHVRDVGLEHAADEAIFQWARENGRTVVSADTDFGTLLAQRNVTRPSVILLRQGVPRSPARQAAFLLANLSSVAEAVEEGSIVVFERDRIRVRALPIR